MAGLEEQFTYHFTLGDNDKPGWHLATKRFSDVLEQYEQGLFVDRISVGGVADRSGVKPGDRLIEINDISVGEADKDKVEEMLVGAGIVKVVVGRIVDLEKKLFRETLKARSENLEEREVINISFEKGQQLGWRLVNERFHDILEENEKGVYVDRITVGGLADRSGIKAGDRLIQSLQMVQRDRAEVLTLHLEKITYKLEVEKLLLQYFQMKITSVDRSFRITVNRPRSPIFTVAEDCKINDIPVGETDKDTVADILACVGNNCTIKVGRLDFEQLLGGNRKKNTEKTSGEMDAFGKLHSSKESETYSFSHNVTNWSHINETKGEEDQFEVSPEKFVERAQRLSKIPNFPNDIDPNPFLWRSQSFTHLSDQEIITLMRSPRLQHFVPSDIPNSQHQRKWFEDYPLHKAIYSKDKALYEALLQSDADIVHDTNEKGETALHVAAISSSVEAVNELLKFGADINAGNKWGQTALHYAAEYKAVPVLEVLLNNRFVDVNKKDANGFTAFHCFVDSCETFCQDWIDTVQLFIKADADINSKTNFGQSILHLLANKTCHKDFLLYLITNYKELKIDFCTSMNETFLHPLIWNASGDEIEMVLNSISNIDERITGRLLNTTDAFGDAPWYLMYKRGEIPLRRMKDFVNRYGIDIEKTDNLGNTGLHQLAITILCQVDRECMTQFLQKIDINTVNVFGQTPVSQIGDDDVLKLFIQCEANVNVADRWGCTPLMHIIGQKPPTDQTLIDILVNQGCAEVKVKDANGSTALHYAAFCGSADQVSRLISYGADTEERDNLGDRPIDTARRHQNRESYDLLKRFSKPDATPATCHFLGNLLTQTSKQVTFSSLQNSDKYVRELLGMPTDLPTFADGLLMEKYVDMSKGNMQEEVAIIEAVRQHVSKICDIVTGYDGLFKMKIFPTGSSVEGTKVGSPDEFDFVLTLENLSKHFVPSEGQKGYATLKIKEQSKCLQELLPFVDGDGYFIAHPFMNYLHRYFKRSIMERRLWNEGQLYYRTEDELFHRHGKPVNTFNMYWIGSKYKKLKISVDLVPALSFPGWWPSYIELDKLRLASESVRAAGCLVLLQMHTENFNVIKLENSVRATVNHFCPDNTKRMLRLSVAPAEIALMKSLPENFRRAYALAKIMKGDDVCPTLEMDRYPAIAPIPDFKKMKVVPSSVLKSYLLKNSTFYVAEQILGSTEENSHPRELAIKIFEYLLKPLSDFCEPTKRMLLRPYFLPFSNIFEITWDEKRLVSNIITQRYNRKAVVSTILGIMGAPSFERLRCETVLPLQSVFP